MGNEKVENSPLSSAMLQNLRVSRLLPRSVPPSLALQTQLMGVEFCASISAAMVQAAQKSTGARSLHAERPPVTELLHSLSGHYGSHTLRRAAGRPLGPCHRSRARRVSKGHHDGRRQLWSLCAAHRHWCRRCGVFLLVGETKVLLPRVGLSFFSTQSVDGLQSNSKRAGTVASANAKPSGDAKIQQRGTYICRNCLDREWKLWKKKGCIGKPPTTLATSFSFDAHSSTSEESEEQLGALQDCSPQGCESFAEQSAISVGRTRRRKRTPRGGSGAKTFASVGKAGTLAATSKANVCAVPKGSLSRRKRGRSASSIKGEQKMKTEVSVAAATKTSNLEKEDKDEAKKQRMQSGPVNMRMSACVEERTISSKKMAVESRKNAAAEKRGTVSEEKEEEGVPVGVQKPSPRNQRRPSRRNQGKNSTPSSSLFSDTLSKLGL